ncbi:hypothetical protein J4475_03695 [Candidatus Woesearchaeota archaeon]|nr:hypothetical protein [Candidatus Woesearchaeota archaeon]
MTRAQSAIETSILIGFLFIILFLFMIVLGNHILDAQQQKEKDMLNDLAYVIDSEISFAARSVDGYERSITIPYSLKGLNFTVEFFNATQLGSVKSSQLILKFANPSPNYEVVKLLPATVTGIIYKGKVSISKRAGIVYLNASSTGCSSGGSLVCGVDGRTYVNECMLNLAGVAKAYDGACIGGNKLFIINSQGQTVAHFDFLGNVIIAGTLAESSGYTATGVDEFRVQNSFGADIAVVDLSTGDFYIDGLLFESQPVLNPSGSNFIVWSPAGEVVLYIDESGNLHLRGLLTERGIP